MRLKLKKLLMLLLIAGILATACSQQEKAEAEETKSEIATVKVDEFESQAVNFVEKEVKIKGTVVHVCEHGGKRCQIIGKDPNTKVKIEAGKVEKFAKELEGSDIIAKGIVKEQKIDIAYLDNWESEVKNSDEKVEGKEIHEGEEEKEGEDHHSKESTLKQIKNLRTQLKESGKDHLSFYSIECTEYQEVKK